MEEVIKLYKELFSEIIAELRRTRQALEKIERKMK